MTITEDENPGGHFPYLTFFFHCLLLILSLVCLLSRLAVKEWRRNFPRFLKTRNIHMSSIRLSVQEREDTNYEGIIYILESAMAWCKNVTGKQVIPQVVYWSGGPIFFGAFSLILVRPFLIFDILSTELLVWDWS